jgi:hypothetical protein
MLSTGPDDVNEQILSTAYRQFPAPAMWMDTRLNVLLIIQMYIDRFSFVVAVHNQSDTVGSHWVHERV